MEKRGLSLFCPIFPLAIIDEACSLLSNCGGTKSLIGRNFFFKEPEKHDEEIVRSSDVLKKKRDRLLLRLKAQGKKGRGEDKGNNQVIFENIDK